MEDIDTVDTLDRWARIVRDVGFPVVMCFLLVYKFIPALDANTMATWSLKEATQANTTRLIEHDARTVGTQTELDRIQRENNWMLRILTGLDPEAPGAVQPHPRHHKGG